LRELGRDVHRFSEAQVPGERLAACCRRVTYISNPVNCPEATLDWLKSAPIKLIRTDDASHWMSVDQPAKLPNILLEVLVSD